MKHSLRAVRWPLVVALGAFALIRPVTRIVTDQLGLSPGPVLPVVLTVVVTAVWVAVVGLSRVPHPLLTLALAGVAYAVLSTLLSAVLSPLLTGELQGPLATPLAIVPVLLVGAGWGLLGGALALLLQRVRTGRREPAGRADR
ncbi:hypothetical protein DT076_16910 [Desertihabitans brevis]|uniref:Uncharacterized protein n=1 Tax=Desertihabitans brevis TaxID=2268447 RepID=A0A367YR08_9ACTN|nr:hypothetical protein [Desertihabitans brevis]RCK68325.1 hypothetical protein DT076_16910 [Desertihabitans brevis]